MINQNTTPTNSHWDAIVIGSGMGGMTAAAYLAAAGKRTLLLEQYEVLGGCTHVFRRKKKWEFEVGMHYMEDCGEHGIVPSILRGLAIDDRIEFIPLDPNGFDTIVYPDETLKVPTNWDQYLSNLLAIFPKEHKQLTRYVTILRTIGAAIDRSRTPSNHRGVFNLMKDSGVYAIWAMAPLTLLMNACGLSSRAKAMLSPECGAYACPPSRTPVVLHAAFLDKMMTGGSWYPKGGGQVFSAHMADVIRSHGGKIMLSTGVSRIVVDGGRVTGVTTTTGEHFYAPVVVSNADIKKTYLDMVGMSQLSRLTAWRVQNYKMSQPFFNLYVGVELDLRNSVNTNYYSCPTWLEPQQVFKKLERVAAQRDKFLDTAMQIMPAYVHCSNTKDPSNTHYSPEGFSAIEVMTLAPYTQVWGSHNSADYWKTNEYQDSKARMTECMLKRLFEVMPQAAGKIVYEEAATPLTQERYTWSSEGSAYGIEPSILQFGPFRPKAKTEIKGLFLAGSSTAWGPSVGGGMISGLHAASAVLDRDLDAEVRSGKVLADRRKLSPIVSDFDALKASMKPVQRKL